MFLVPEKDAIHQKDYHFIPGVENAQIKLERRRSKPVECPSMLGVAKGPTQKRQMITLFSGKYVAYICTSLTKTLRGLRTAMIQRISTVKKNKFINKQNNVMSMQN